MIWRILYFSPFFSFFLYLFLFFVEASLPGRLDNQKPRCSCWRYNTVTWEMLNRNVESCILKKISFFFLKKKMCFLKTWFWNPRTLKCLVKHVEIIIWKLLNFCCGHKLPKEIFPFFEKVTKDSFVCVCVWGEDGTKRLNCDVHANNNRSNNYYLLNTLTHSQFFPAPLQSFILFYFILIFFYMIPTTELNTEILYILLFTFPFPSLRQYQY